MHHLFNFIVCITLAQEIGELSEKTLNRHIVSKDTANFCQLTSCFVEIVNCSVIALSFNNYDNSDGYRMPKQTH